jgi:hypothetical protein
MLCVCYFTTNDLTKGWVRTGMCIHNVYKYLGYFNSTECVWIVPRPNMHLYVEVE